MQHHLPPSSIISQDTHQGCAWRILGASNQEKLGGIRKLEMQLQIEPAPKIVAWPVWRNMYLTAMQTLPWYVFTSCFSSIKGDHKKVWKCNQLQRVNWRLGVLCLGVFLRDSQSEAPISSRSQSGVMSHETKGSYLNESLEEKKTSHRKSFLPAVFDIDNKLLFDQLRGSSN